MPKDSKINFNEDFDLNRLLSERFGKKENEVNRDTLRTIGEVYKKVYKLIEITDKLEFYNFIEGHPLFKELK